MSAEELITGEDYGFALDFTDNSSAINLPLNVTGVNASGEVGSVQTKQGTTFGVNGVEGTGVVGNSFSVFIWSQVNTNQSSAWAPVADAQSPNWTQIAA